MKTQNANPLQFWNCKGPLSQKFAKSMYIRHSRNCYTVATLLVKIFTLFFFFFRSILKTDQCILAMTATRSLNVKRLFQKQIWNDILQNCYLSVQLLIPFIYSSNIYLCLKSNRYQKQFILFHDKLSQGLNPEEKT